MSPETKSQLLGTVDELKRAITQCLGEDHESKGVIAQIERTIARIEQKTKSSLSNEVNKASTSGETFPSYA
ncbi:MAG: hypothetical protein C5B53_11695 [Candidatus Melainabacteria bacterium]|nr:MAG: hypothetical protein C5B53_11695 [Candidatus Melainabacteria bacterium]